MLSTFFISLALLPFAFAQESSDIKAIEAHFTQSHIVPDLFASFNPSALLSLNYAGEPNFPQIHTFFLLTFFRCRRCPARATPNKRTYVVLRRQFLAHHNNSQRSLRSQRLLLPPRTRRCRWMEPIPLLWWTPTSLAASIQMGRLVTGL